MLSVISMLITSLASFFGDILPLSIELDENVSISIRGIILFFFIILLAYNLYDIFSKRRTK